jgi:hypothetical protein
MSFAFCASFSNARIELIRLKVTRIEVMGDKEVSHMTTDERRNIVEGLT